MKSYKVCFKSDGRYIQVGNAFPAVNVEQALVHRANNSSASAGFMADQEYVVIVESDTTKAEVFGPYKLKEITPIKNFEAIQL